MRRSGIAAIVALIGSASCALVAGLGDERQLAQPTEGEGTPDGSTITPGNDSSLEEPPDSGPVQPDGAPADGGFSGNGDIVVKGQVNAYGIALNAAYLLWSTQGTTGMAGTGAVHMLLRASNQEVTPPPATKQATPRQVIVDNNVAYWIAANDPQVTDGGINIDAPILGALPLGGAAAVIDDDNRANRTRRVAVLPANGGADDGYVFIAQADRVRRYPRVGGNGSSIVSNIPQAMQPVSALAVGMQHVFWFNANTVSRHVKVDPQQGPPPQVETVGTVNLSIVDMTLSGNTIWLAASSGEIVNLAADQLNQPAPTPIATTGPAQHAMIVVGDVAYITRGTPNANDGQIMRVKKDGTKTVLAHDQPEPRELTVDTATTPYTVYWTNGGDGTIRKIADQP